MRLLTGLLLAAILTSCSTTETFSVKETPFPMAEMQNSQIGWWAIRFKKSWPEEQENAPFFIDLLIAEQIIEPLLYKYEDKLILWRFHRRAARDEAGNLFSFIIYTDNETAQLLSKAIYENPLTLSLSENHFLEQVTYNDFFNNSSGEAYVHGGSDNNWPIEMQRAWPYFIMGTSVSWLSLINETSPDYLEPGNRSLQHLLDAYKKTSDHIDELWLEFGAHAYLHHLNAIHAYKPVKVRY